MLHRTHTKEETRGARPAPGCQSASHLSRQSPHQMQATIPPPNALGGSSRRQRGQESSSRCDRSLPRETSISLSPDATSRAHTAWIPPSRQPRCTSGARDPSLPPPQRTYRSNPRRDSTCALHAVPRCYDPRPRPTNTASRLSAPIRHPSPPLARKKKKRRSVIPPGALLSLTLPQQKTLVAVALRGRPSRSGGEESARAQRSTREEPCRQRGEAPAGDSSRAEACRSGNCARPRRGAPARRASIRRRAAAQILEKERTLQRAPARSAIGAALFLFSRLFSSRASLLATFGAAILAPDTTPRAANDSQTGFDAAFVACGMRHASRSQRWTCPRKGGGAPGRPSPAAAREDRDERRRAPRSRQRAATPKRAHERCGMCPKIERHSAPPTGWEIPRASALGKGAGPGDTGGAELSLRFRGNRCRRYTRRLAAIYSHAGIKWLERRSRCQGPKGRDPRARPSVPLLPRRRVGGALQRHGGGSDAPPGLIRPSQYVGRR